MKLIITENQLERLFVLEQTEDNYCTRDKFKPLFHVKNELVKNGINENEISEDRKWNNECRITLSFPKNKNVKAAFYEDGTISIEKSYNTPSYNSLTEDNTKSIQYTGTYKVKNDGSIIVNSFWVHSYTDDKNQKQEKAINFSDSINTISNIVNTFNKPHKKTQTQPTNTIEQNLDDIHKYLSGDVEIDDLNEIEKIIKKREKSICDIYYGYSKKYGDDFFEEIKDAWVSDEVNHKRIIEYVFDLIKNNNC